MSAKRDQEAARIRPMRPRIGKTTILMSRKLDRKLTAGLRLFGSRVRQTRPSPCTYIHIYTQSHSTSRSYVSFLLVLHFPSPYSLFPFLFMSRFSFSVSIQHRLLTVVHSVYTLYTAIYHLKCTCICIYIWPSRCVYRRALYILSRSATGSMFQMDDVKSMRKTARRMYIYALLLFCLYTVYIYIYIYGTISSKLLFSVCYATGSLSLL